VVIFFRFIRPYRRDPIAECDRVTQTNYTKRPGRLVVGRMVRADVLRIGGKNSEVPDRLAQIRLEAPKKQWITFKNRGLRFICHLQRLLWRGHEEFETRDVRQKESSSNFNSDQ
jgi:hypothetical protein